MAMRLNSLSLQKKFSIRWRHLYISASIWSGVARRGCCEITSLAPRSLSSAMISLLSKALAVEGLVGDQGTELDTLDQRRHSGRVKALSGQQHEADEIAQGVGQGQDLGPHAALGAANGLARSPPFAP